MFPLLLELQFRRVSNETVRGVDDSLLQCAHLVAHMATHIPPRGAIGLEMLLHMCAGHQWRVFLLLQGDRRVGSRSEGFQGGRPGCLGTRLAVLGGPCFKVGKQETAYISAALKLPSLLDFTLLILQGWPLQPRPGSTGPWLAVASWRTSKCKPGCVSQHS